MIFDRYIWNEKSNREERAEIGMTSDIKIQRLSCTDNTGNIFVQGMLNGYAFIETMGLNPRKLKLTGSLGNGVNPQGGTYAEILDPTILQQDTLIRASGRTNLVPSANLVRYNKKHLLLGYPNWGLWKIDAFTWNREAAKIGMYEFDLDLVYVWKDESESMLFIN